MAFTYGDPFHPSAVTSISSGKTYSYDANGNMATGGNRTFVWDIDNRVTSVAVGGSTTYMEYDYTGMRVKKDGFGGMTLYPFQGYEIDPSGTITKFIRIGVETFASKRGTSKYFYHNDHLGSVNVITDINGARVQLNEYDPWGGVSRTEDSIDPTHRFTGQQLDPETGIYYYGGRYYDPEISRFISPDPFVQAPGDPQNLNRYSYVNNNPQNYIDPSGYGFWKSIGRFFKKIVGYIVAAVVTYVTGNPFLGGLAGGLVSAAVNRGNLLKGALIGGITGGILGGIGGSGSSPGDDGGGGVGWGTLFAASTGTTAADYATRGAARRSRDTRPDLGPVGNFIRSRPIVNTDYEKSLFEKYWLGEKGDMELPADEFEQVKDDVSMRSALTTDVVKWNEQTLIRKQFSFASNQKFDAAFGTASVFYNTSGQAVGFYDKYNFDVKWTSWADWWSGRNLKTLGVQFGCIIRGNCSPFNNLWPICHPEVVGYTNESTFLDFDWSSICDHCKRGMFARPIFQFSLANSGR